MKIKRCPVIFNNVISTEVKCKPEEWYHAALDLRNAVIKNGLYGTGPIIYQVGQYDERKDEAEFRFYLPVNAPISMPENDKYHFDEEFLLTDGLVIRHADLDDDLEESYELLEACAGENGFVLQEPYYHIYLDVFGDGIIDIFAPIIEESV